MWQNIKLAGIGSPAKNSFFTAKKKVKKSHFCVHKIPPKIELNRHVRLFFLDSRANQSATAKISESERSLPHQELSSRRCLHKHCGQYLCFHRAEMFAVTTPGSGQLSLIAPITLSILKRSL